MYLTFEYPLLFVVMLNRALKTPVYFKNVSRNLAQILLPSSYTSAAHDRIISYIVIFLDPINYISFSHNVKHLLWLMGSTVMMLSCHIVRHAHLSQHNAGETRVMWRKTELMHLHDHVHCWLLSINVHEWINMVFECAWKYAHWLSCVFDFLKSHIIQNQNQKGFYCQVCLHTQGTCLGVGIQAA